MKIGFVQFAPALGNRDETIKKLSPLIEEADGADLLVLPELCNSGYNFTSRQMAAHLSEDPTKSEFVDYLHSKCKKLKMTIATGFNERYGDALFNSALLISPEGLIGKYRKLHLFMNEKDYFTPGDMGLPVFDIGPCKVGMLICFDWMFPEAFRILALKGAEIICHPSNLVLPGFAQQAAPVHAMLNRVYIVTANRIGREGNTTFTGFSMISGPKGEVLASAPSDLEDVKIAHVDIEEARDKFVTARNNAFEDRRPEEYMELIKDPPVRRSGAGWARS